MAYRKRSFRRRFRKHGSRRVARKVKRFVKRAISRRTEKKYYTALVSSTFAAVSTTPVETLFCNPAQGTTGLTRVGRKLRITKIRFSNCVLAGGQSNIVADDKYNLFRICIATWYKGATSTPFTVQAIGLSSTMDRENTPYLGKIYYDKLIALKSDGRDSTGYMPALRRWTFTKRFKNLTITYSDDTVNTWDKQLIMSCVSDSTASPNPGFINGSIKVWWEDA